MIKKLIHIHININTFDEDGNKDSTYRYYLKKSDKVELKVTKELDGDYYDYTYKKEYISIFNENVLSSYIRYFNNKAMDKIYSKNF